MFYGNVVIQLGLVCIWIFLRMEGEMISLPAMPKEDREGSTRKYA